MVPSRLAMTIPRRTKSEGHLDLCVGGEQLAPPKTMPSRRPVSTAALAAAAGAKECPRKVALEQWSALADREGQSAYEIHTVSFLSKENRRGIITDWCYKVADHFVIDRRVVSTAWSYIECYLSIDSSRHVEITNRGCWLVILTCLQLAIKMRHNDAFIRAILPNLCAMCRFSQHQIAEKELQICGDLRWYLNPPVPALFLEAATPLIDEISITEENHAGIAELSRFLIELSVYDLELSHEKGSSVAHAAILVAMNHLRTSTSTVNRWLCLTLEHSSHLTDRCIPRLQNLLKANERMVRCSSPTNVEGNV